MKIFAAWMALSACATGQTESATSAAPPVAAPAAAPASTSTLYALGLVGISASGSSTSSPSQQYFAEFNVITPLNCFQRNIVHPLQHKCWMWLNPRIASVPSSGASALNALSSSLSTLPGGLAGQTIQQITQSLEFQGGVEYYFKSPWEGAQFGRDNSWGRTGASLIAGGGIVSPFGGDSFAPEFALNSNVAQQFNQNPGLPPQYPQLALALCSYGYAGTLCPKTPPATAPSTVAFVQPGRTRFFRDFYAGIRLRTFYLKGDCPDPSLHQQEPNCKMDNTFPGTFDVRLGEDETVTAGHLAPLVLTLAASYPLPATGGSVRIFGSIYLRMGVNRTADPLILLPSQGFAALDQPSVVVQPVPAPDRDYYRLGLGVDLIPLIAKWAAH